MGEHYNSIRRGDDPCIRGQAQAEHYPIGHEMEKIPELVNGFGFQIGNKSTA